MRRLLPLFALLIVSSASAVTITSSSITNYTGYVIASDATSGISDRDHLALTSQVDVGTPAGSYRVDWSLLDPTGAVMASSSSTVLTSITGAQTFTGSLTPSSSNRLVPGTRYRVKTDVINTTSNTVVATSTQAPGNFYIHFIGTSSTGPAYNVVSEVTAVTINRSWLLETDSSRTTIPVRVDYKLYRYDNWLGVNSTQDIDVTIGGQLVRDSDNTTQAASVSSNTTTVTGVDSYDNTVVPKAPAVVTGFKIIQVDPAAILPPNYYRASVEIGHTESSLGGTYSGNTKDSSAPIIYHLTGEVIFGNANAIHTHIAGLSTAPTVPAGPPAPIFIPGTQADITITPSASAGTVDGVSGYTFGGTAVNVTLAANGIAQVQPLWSGTTNLNPATTADRNGTVNGITFKRAGTAYLDSTGAHSDITAILPQGIGWAADKVTGLLDASVTFSAAVLDQNLAPTGSLVISPGAGAFYLCEETKPIYIEATAFGWNTATGDFFANGTTPHSIQKPLMDFINSYSASYSDPSVGIKRSNAFTYNFVATSSNVSFKKGTSNGGEMTADLTFNNGAFLSHFPWNTPVIWTGGVSHVMHIVSDLINPTGSQLSAPTNLVNTYNQHCQDAVESGCGAEQTANVVLTPGTPLNFTGDGGLSASGSVSTTLSWGWNSLTSTYTHQVTSTFTAANFFMAGTFLRGDLNLLGTDLGAANLLLSGVDPSNLATAERPATAAYEAGLGDYAGMNFRVSTLTTLPGQALSTLQGTVVGGYDLTTRSKYYTRKSGVTGIHESPTGPGNVTLGGYLFTLNTFGFSFLSSEIEDSRTNGHLDIITPNNFTLDFTGLEFSCLGALESFELTAGSKTTDGKQFDKWDALFTPLAVSFQADNECNPGAGTTMILGFSAHASHFSEGFAGSLGIENTGHFARYSDHTSDGIPTRLTLPGSLTMTGTTGETYSFFPTQGAYLNDDPSGDGEGFWSLFGTLDIPFFEDLQVHLQTRCGSTTAGTPDPETVSPIYLMGGWPTYGWKAGSDTPFTASKFDTTQTGRPVALATYRDQATESYLPRAQKLWLGIVNFDYPMKWSNTTFSFTGFAPITEDLLVLNTEHQLNFLDAKTADISFGIQYSGLPTINLSSIAFNAIDDATGVSSAFAHAAGDAVFDWMEKGVDDFNDMLSDKAEDMLGDLLDQLTSTMLDNFLAEVKAATPSGAKISSATLTPILNRYFYDPNSQLVDKLQDLAGAASSANQMISDIDARLAQIESALDAVTTGISVDINGNTLSTAAHGLLQKYSPSGGTDLERAIFKGVANELIDVVATAVSSADVVNKINEVLAEIDPTLQAAQDALLQVKDLVSAVRAKLGATGELTKEFQDIIAAATAQLEAASDKVGAIAEKLVLDLEVEDQVNIDAIIADWKSQLTTSIHDAVFESQFIADIQEAVKEQIYDLQGAFNSAIDTAFAALNQMIREALSEALAGIDEAINNNFLQDVKDYMGSGSLTGYAHINGDSLDEARIDGKFRVKVPDDLDLAAYLEIKELDSDGPEGCGGAGANLTEVSIGALDVPLGWTGVSGEELHADLGVKFALDSSTGQPLGIGGSFEMTQGSISFETFEITSLGASVMVGSGENYLAAKIGMTFGEYQMAGGVFFGHSCTIEPLEMVDPLVASVLTMPSFTGIYCYGEATFPIYGTGTCIFNISGKAGAGVFYFTEGPTYGGRLTAGVYGEALCAVDIGGEISLVGVKSGSDYSFAGTGRLYGKAGVCKFCLEADINASFNYTKTGGWKVDY